MSVRHVVWDWNSTLFDDYHAVVAASNDSFAPYGIAPFTGESLREVFHRPLDVCAARIIGRPLKEGEWESINDTFHNSYHRYMVDCSLTEGALELLDSVQEQGKSQSLLSMWLHDRLTQKVAEFGIGKFFNQIDGRREQHDAGAKQRHLLRHLNEQNLDPATVVLIGDAADDGKAAREVGTHAVLYSQGSDSVATLEATGFPVVSTLAEAVKQVSDS